MMRAHQWDNLLHDCRYIETQITLLLLVWVMHAVYTVHSARHHGQALFIRTRYLISLSFLLSRQFGHLVNQSMHRLCYVLHRV